MTDELARVQHDSQVARDLVDHITREIEAARARPKTVT
jgi:hypothetical protein